MRKPPYTHINAYVLAGGKSRRMGQDKGLMMFHGKPMIVHMLDLASHTASNIYISSNDPDYEAFGYKRIQDEIRDIGPIGGVSSCLRHSDAQLNLMMACDIPYISIELLNYLIQAASVDYDLIIPYLHGLESQPLCAIYNKSMLEIIDKQIAEGKYKLKDLIHKCRLKKLIIDESLDLYHPSIFKNINKPEDIKKIDHGEWFTK